MSTVVGRPQLRVASLSATALPATLATAALLLLMHSLIVTNMNPPEIKKRTKIDFISEVPELTVLTTYVRPERPEEVALAPERMEPQVALSTDDLAGVWRNDPIPPVTDTGPIGTGSNMVVPYMRLQPDYPARALKRGIEGYVDLAFDISAAGSTQNIRVIEARPEGVFERAAIRALEKWKYKVPVTDGKPQGQVDMMTRLTFELER